jgi:hypothetical protein
MTRLRGLASLAARVPENARAPYAARLTEARFVEGDLQLTLDNPAAAFQAYGEAMRRATDPEDRLRGMIGRARALSRLQRKEEARQDYSNARALFDGDRSFAGRGRDYWEIALDALAREVR